MSLEAIAALLGHKTMSMTMTRARISLHRRIDPRNLLGGRRWIVVNPVRCHGVSTAHAIQVATDDLLDGAEALDVGGIDTCDQRLRCGGEVAVPPRARK